MNLKAAAFRLFVGVFEYLQNPKQLYVNQKQVCSTVSFEAILNMLSEPENVTKTSLSRSESCLVDNQFWVCEWCQKVEKKSLK